jgi:hypothetical protein
MRIIAGRKYKLRVHEPVPDCTQPLPSYMAGKICIARTPCNHTPYSTYGAWYFTNPEYENDISFLRCPIFPDEAILIGDYFNEEEIGGEK